MDTPVVTLPTLDDLRNFVRQTLCERDRLDPDQSRLRQGLVRRRGRPCGLFFQVQGPRLLRTYAVWAGDESRVLFYDSTGERFAEASLSESPDPADLASGVSWAQGPRATAAGGSGATGSPAGAPAPRRPASPPAS